MWGLDGIVAFKSFFLIVKLYQPMIPLPMSSSVPSFHLCVAALQSFYCTAKQLTASVHIPLSVWKNIQPFVFH